MRALDGVPLCEWLRNSASTAPEAPAVIEEERVVTFGELLHQSTTLALRFIELGVAPQDRIVLVCNKTADAIVALFASLFAGAIYVPLHPRWPGERIENTVAQCSARLLIREERNRLCITDPRSDAEIPWNGASHLSAESLPKVDATNPALILFTSGSTGKPKGVVLSHNAVAAFVRWTAEEFAITEYDRIACPSPLGFDLSTFDIFNMALRRACCVIVPENIVWMPRFLAHFIEEARITCWYSVPSILSGMAQDGGMAGHHYPHLRLILFAGEVYPPAGVRRLQQAVPDAALANLYGPTETNVVTWARVPASFDGTEPLPIGHACPYAEVMLDDATGELLAGGESLMDGYWGNPEETMRVFRTVGDIVYYRTGDRAAFSDDGGYRFIGRLDRQVKRRGFRIELGEIETALARMEDILEAAAVASAGASTGACITAFVRLQGGRTIAPLDVKAHCALILPPYMLPDRIVLLDAIPKGGRGKIDYLALASLAEELNGD